MMRFTWCVGVWLAIAMMAGCAKPDPTVILGRWKADSFAIDSLKFPLSPNIEVTRSQLILKTPDGTVLQAFELSQIKAQKDNIELEFKDGLGLSLVFSVENASRIHFRVPIIGTDLAYTKQ